jgi:hypothetical protein
MQSSLLRCILNAEWEFFRWKKAEPALLTEVATHPVQWKGITEYHCWKDTKQLSMTKSQVSMVTTKARVQKS